MLFLPVSVLRIGHVGHGIPQDRGGRVACVGRRRNQSYHESLMPLLDLLLRETRFLRQHFQVFLWQLLCGSVAHGVLTIDSGSLLLP